MQASRYSGGAAAVLLGLGLLAGGAAAQSTAAPPSGDSTAAAGTSSAAPPADGYSLDTPIETIAANPNGKAILDKDLPGLTTHPMYDQFKSMSLKEVQPMSQGAITDQALAKAQTDLAALKPGS